MSLSKQKKVVILGIDPGLADTGFGVIAKTGSHLAAIDYGSIKTKAGVANEKRLAEIFDGLTQLITKYRPTVVAVEKLFFCKNVTTAIAVGQARGVALLAAGRAGCDISEFTPLQVKQALTSYGRASKHQVQYMVTAVLGLARPPRSDDAADALAIAICAAHSSLR